ncbi:MAG: hypothetical protein HOP30_14480 [Cyclobacteriaceae bacterium]|nr:hypothetical protein [Cyclobacteriaceae bacterium]
MIKNSALILLAVICSSTAFGQSEDVILKAMQDELDRNHKELTLKNFDRPFFIMYGLTDVKTMRVSASMGALTNSSEDRDRMKTTTRLLVGDYDFNDESLDDNHTTGPSAMEISLPLDDDYWGIRRSFWASTDNVYRSAARHFEKNKQTLKETGKTLSEIPHRRFAKVAPVKIIQSLTPATYSLPAWEQRVRKMSGVIANAPNITNSFVFVTYSEGHKYLVNTEGLVSKIPFSNATLMMGVQLKNSDGKFSFDRETYEAKTLDQLPSDDVLLKDIQKLIQRVEANQKLAELEEEYTGPVLLEGKAVAEALAGSILRSREGIFASDNIAKLKGLQFDEETKSADAKIGKPIINTQITIKAKPKLTSFQGIELTGNFILDNEGVVPPDEVTIIENGILRNLLNNRTLTSATQIANGFSSGPGVLEVTVVQKDTDQVLKNKLIQQAKKEGLSFALIFRESGSRMGFANAYKVYVEDGREELIKNVSLRELSFKMWKRILGASEKYAAFNIDDVTFERSFLQTTVSMIVPQSILLEELEVKPIRMPSLKEEEYISKPTN